ncbi:hypothetical protein ACJJTC_002877 [Scirpophaga incertulas]
MSTLIGSERCCVLDITRLIDMKVMKSNFHNLGNILLSRVSWQCVLYCCKGESHIHSGEPGTVPVYVPTESVSLALEIKESLKSLNVTLSVVEEGSEARPRVELVRRLRSSTCSFLVLEHALWARADLWPVEPPPTRGARPPRAVRVADLAVLRQHAPALLELFLLFSPSLRDLREVLELEVERPEAGIMEAACAWSNRNREKIAEWTALRWESVYDILVFLCEDDPDSGEYRKTVATLVQAGIFNEHIKISFRLQRIKCADEYALTKYVVQWQQHALWERVAGTVVVGEGAAVGAARAAAAAGGPLLLADLPHATAAAAAPALRAATGCPDQLARALLQFVAAQGWARLAILSEATAVAADVATGIRAADKIATRELLIEPDATGALLTLIRAEARIFFVNAGPKSARRVLCAARELGAFPRRRSVRVDPTRVARRGAEVRQHDRAHAPVLAADRVVLVARRGGGAAAAGAAPARGAGGAAGRVARPRLATARRAARRRARHSVRGAPRVSAVPAAARQRHPFWQRFPIVPHSDSRFTPLASIVAETTPFGLAQKLTAERGALAEPYVYVHRWSGAGAQLVAAWQLAARGPRPLLAGDALFPDGAPGDGSRRCLLPASRDPFELRCLDGALAAAGLLAVAALPLAYAARRARAARLAERSRRLRARLLARGRRVAGALAPLLVERGALVLGRELGAGASGRVRLGVLRAGRGFRHAVAAKELREAASPNEEREFLAEAVTLSALRHPHVVRLLGVVAAGGPPLVLMEHAFFGDLGRYLRERKYLVEIGDETDMEAKEVSAEELTRFGREAASALDYLRSKQVVHRDVRASNCLVDGRRSLKLGDFGLARRTEAAAGSEYASRRRGLFPVLWMAPESLERGVFTPAADAWALGVLLLELATLGARPYGDWAPARVVRHVRAGGRPPLPEDLCPAARALMLRCWAGEAARRASAAEVEGELARAPATLRPALAPLALRESCHRHP